MAMLEGASHGASTPLPAAADRRAPDTAGAPPPPPAATRRAPHVLSRPAVLLGVVGAMGGATALGTMAYRVAHPLPDVLLIGALGAVAGGAAGAALPAVVRALKWSAIAAAILAVGAAALWAIHQVDPLLRLQFPLRW